MPEFTNTYLSNVPTVTPLGIGGLLDVRLTVPAGVSPHIGWRFWSQGLSQAFIFEGTTLSGGVLVASHNMNRNDPRTAALEIRSTPTVGALGTVIQNGSWFGGKPKEIPGFRQVMQDMILKSEEEYLFRIVSQGNNQAADVEFVWYEPGG